MSSYLERVNCEDNGSTVKVKDGKYSVTHWSDPVKKALCDHAYDADSFSGKMTCRHCGQVHKDNFYTRKVKPKRSWLAAVLVALGLSGCSVDNSNTCGTYYGYTEKQTDVAGLTLEPSQEMHVTSETVSALYQETQACMGLTAEGPIVAWKNFSVQHIPGTYAIYHPGGLVWINREVPEGQGFYRDCQTDSEALKHEFVHHILNFNGIDWHHGDPLFAQCGIGVNISN